jgi:hypothetical protein
MASFEMMIEQTPFPPMNPCKSKIYKGSLFMGVFNPACNPPLGEHSSEGLDLGLSQIPGWRIEPLRPYQRMENRAKHDLAF